MILVVPSDLGDFEIIPTVMVISVKNRVVSKAILPGITSGGITKPILGKEMCTLKIFLWSTFYRIAKQ